MRGSFVRSKLLELPHNGSMSFKKLTRPGACVLGPSFSEEIHWCVIAAGGIPQVADFPLAASSKVSLMMFSPAESSWSGWLGNHKVRTEKHSLGIADAPVSFQTVKSDNKLGHRLADAISAQ